MAQANLNSNPHKFTARDLDCCAGRGLALPAKWVIARASFFDGMLIVHPDHLFSWLFKADLEVLSSGT